MAAADLVWVGGITSRIALDWRILSWHPSSMPISARNQLEGKILEVTLGDIMPHVVVRVGKSQIESVITRRSVEQLNLKKGDKITA